MRRASLLGCVLAICAGCSVDDAFLDDTAYSCTRDGDCGEGWSCVNTDPVGPRVCARSYGELEICRGACDGRCTARGECLRGCTVGAAEACPDGATCLSSSAIAPQQGVCYSVDTPCSSAEACGAGLCLGVIGGSEAPLTSYCLPPPISVGLCPEGYSFLAFADDQPVCLPNCDVVDTSCPLGLGCLTRSAGVVEGGLVVASFCFPGLVGGPCDDDTNCLLGDCVGGTCTISCAQADAITGLSEGVGCVQLGFSLGAIYDLRCQPESGSCESRYRLGFRCGGDVQCADGLFCDVIPEGIPGAGQAYCTRECFADSDCASLGTADRPAACRGPATFRRCAPGG